MKQPTLSIGNRDLDVKITGVGLDNDEWRATAGESALGHNYTRVASLRFECDAEILLNEAGRDFMRKLAELVHTGALEPPPVNML